MLHSNMHATLLVTLQGLKSSTDARGASAAHAVALDKKYDGGAVQVRKLIVTYMMTYVKQGILK